MHLYTMSEGWVGLGKSLRLWLVISPITIARMLSPIIIDVPTESDQIRINPS